MGTSIIYVITNLINNKKYVGQTNNLYKRWYKHRSDANRQEYPICRAIRKYGPDNFSIVQIDSCEDDMANDRETFWIKELKTLTSEYGYNTGYIAKNNHFTTEETRKKLSESHMGEKNSMFGKNHSPEAIEKIRKAKTGVKASEETRKKLSLSHQNVSDETRLKLSQAAKGKSAGEKSATAKLNNAAVLDIREQAKNGVKRKDLAIKYNVSKSLIDMIINRKIWTLI